MLRLAAFTAVPLALLAGAQSLPRATPAQNAANPGPAASGLMQAPSPAPAASVTLPVGTEIPMTLNHAINGKNIHPGDAIYLITSFPITAEDRVIVPVGSYVQGEVTAAKRPGRIKGRGQLKIHFSRLILPNGYTVNLAGALDSAPDLNDAQVKGQEGTIERNGEKGNDVKRAAETAGYGGLIGLGVHGGRGAMEGAAAGGIAGALWSILSRGSDLYIPAGTALSLALQRPLTLEWAKLDNPGGTPGTPRVAPPPNPPQRGGGYPRPFPLLP
ncbi:MAG: TraB/TrbI/VirB10 family type IV secretion system protein [Terriglobales bacterium]